jgi:2-polyprenyl-3-methyl-5-hydroxy-6-metoxy-1,4-benzoquinol methylase
MRDSTEYDQTYFEDRNKYPTREAEFRQIFVRLVRQIKDFCPQGRLLDVGCGLGILLDVARSEGFEVAGVEVSSYASAVARDRFNLDVRTGLLQETRFSDEEFDIIILNHVLEHVPNFWTDLAEAKHLLKPNGLLVVGVPNFDSLFRLLLGSRWPSLLPDQHLWQFTPVTLNRLLTAAGFLVEQTRMSDNHNYAKHFIPPLKLGIYLLSHLATVLHRADSMVVFARKQEGERQ